MTLIRFRFATTNAPESYKKGLLHDKVARARRVNEWATRRAIDVRAIQEAGNYAEQVDQETSVRKVVWARFNSFVNGRRVGNGLDVNRRRWRVRLLDDLTIGKGPGSVHIAVAQLTERKPPAGVAPFVFKAYGVHKPTRRATNSSLRDVIDAALIEHTRRDDTAGIPWVMLGDFNGAFNHGVKLGDSGPDHIRGSKHFEPLGQRVSHRPLLSDHDFLLADAAVTT